MYKIIFAIFCILLFCLSCYSCLFKTSAKKTTSKTDTFTNIEESPKYVIMFFYADWCGHCTRFKPEFEKFEKNIKSQVSNNSYELKYMNGDDKSTQELMSKHNVTGFPTVVCENSLSTETQTYKGPRTESGLIEFFKPILLQ